MWFVEKASKASDDRNIVLKDMVMKSLDHQQLDFA